MLSRFREDKGSPYYRFSNRPIEVKRFQTVHQDDFDFRSRARASLRNGHEGPSIMEFGSI